MMIEFNSMDIIPGSYPGTYLLKFEHPDIYYIWNKPEGIDYGMNFNLLYQKKAIFKNPVGWIKLLDSRGSLTNIEYHDYKFQAPGKDNPIIEHNEKIFGLNNMHGMKDDHSNEINDPKFWSYI